MTSHSIVISSSPHFAVPYHHSGQHKGRGPSWCRIHDAEPCRQPHTSNNQAMSQPLFTEPTSPSREGLYPDFTMTRRARAKPESFHQRRPLRVGMPSLMESMTSHSAVETGTFTKLHKVGEDQQRGILPDVELPDAILHTIDTPFHNLLQTITLLATTHAVTWNLLKTYLLFCYYH